MQDFLVGFHSMTGYRKLAFSFQNGFILFPFKIWLENFSFKGMITNIIMCKMCCNDIHFENLGCKRRVWLCPLKRRFREGKMLVKFDSSNLIQLLELWLNDSIFHFLTI